MLLYGPNWAKFGPSLGQIGPKQPIFKVETRDFGSLYVFENTHHYQCIHDIIWAYTRWNLGQVDQNWVHCWAKFEPNWTQLDRSTYFDRRDLPLGSRHSFDYYDHPQGISEVTLKYIISFELTLVKIWVKWTKIGPNVGPKWFNYGRWDTRLLTSIR